MLTKHWAESRKAYSLFLLTLVAFIAGWFAFILMIGNPYSFGPSNQAVLYFAGLFIAGFLSGSLLFRDLFSKPRKINYLLLPSSALEKLVCVLFYGVLIFFVAYSTIFYAIDCIAIKMANSASTSMLMSHSTEAMQWRERFGLTETIPVSRPINVFSTSADLFIFYPGDNIDLFTAFFPIQSAFILGSVYFNKNGLFKTIVVLLLIWLAFFVLEMKFLMPMFPNNVNTERVFTSAVEFNNRGNETFYTLPFWIGDTANFLLRYGITPVLWLATYYRLKEKEI